MKQDFLFKKKWSTFILKWLLSFVISNIILLLFLVILTFLQMQQRLSDSILKVIFMILISVSTCACSWLYQRFTSIKGIFSGLISAGMYSLIKLIMSLCTGGVGGSNFLIYICIFSSALLGGILSANAQSRQKSVWSK